MKILIFDMDGVLVDPTESYRGALVDTVEHFAGVRPEHDEIVAIKNEGGYNDNTLVAERIVRRLGSNVPYDELLRYFRLRCWGASGDGSTPDARMRRERWLVEDGLFERLRRTHRLAIYTGRGMRSARFTLDRFTDASLFDPIMTVDQVERGKPDPEGLFKILESTKAREALFVGDNADDANCARAAGVPFVGIAADSSARREETVAMFEALGARAVIGSVNELEGLPGTELQSVEAEVRV
jgi:HAD superfamily phosphatase